MIQVSKTEHGLHTTMATIVQLPSGSWRAQVRRGGVTKGETFKRHADAKRWASEMESKIESIKAIGSAKTPKGSTFADFVDKYVEETDSVKKHGKNKRATLKRLKVEFKGVLMSDFSLMHLRDFVDRRVKEKTQAGDTVSGVTIAIDLSYISTVLHWAKEVKNYDIDVSIVSSARASLKRRGLSTKSVERDREISDEELKKITAAYEVKDARQKIPMAVLIAFALASAMRQEEICTIRIEDINFDENEKTVIIRNRKDPEDKIGNDQIVPLLPAAWDIVAKAIKGRKTGAIFPYDPHSVSASFTRVCKQCEIEDLHFHDLRHTAIGNLFAIGLGIVQVALISGHKEWKMLKRYTHIKARDVQKAVKYLLGVQVLKAETLSD
ncbi:integrase [Pseudomonas corrugata]|jgi:integrase|uniref:site-specific integrase n=1 Tax=Pseudomonas corrugata TaxID=47879 RepID=UPI00285BF188|nr:site-specific integrase [Pseudomonas corrugata]MDR7283712.1 integrase [Pseudomonas corrugata]